MRREKAVKIDGKDIIVRELKTSDVIEMFEGPEGRKLIIGLASGAPQDIASAMRKCVDVPPEEFDRLTEGINNFTLIESAFREVNSDFFGSLPQKMEAIGGVIEAMQKRGGPSSKRHAGSPGKAT